MNAGSITTSGAVNLTAGKVINEAGVGLISGGLLTTNSTTGETLNNANTVTSFNATNTASGNISLTNTVAPLTITGISQAGGGLVTVGNTGAIAITGASSAVGGGAINLTATGGAITESGSGALSTTGMLTTSSAGGQTLGGANTVGTFNATNITSGGIQLTNTAALLTIAGISQAGGGNVTVGNTGAITTSGAITTAANGNISLTATTGTETIGAVVTAGGSGTVGLTATGGTSDILVNSTVSSTSGAISATVGQNITLNAGSISTSGAVNLTAGKVINEAGAGIISGGLLTTISAGGQTLNNANTVTGFNATNAGGDIQLTNNSATLTTTGINQTAGGKIVIVNSGSINDTGTINTTGNITLTATSGSITESGSGAITNAALLTTNSTSGQTLNGANNVASFYGTNTLGGDVQLKNSGLLTITGITEVSGRSVNVQNSGAVTITGLINSGSNGTVTLDTLGAGSLSGGAGLVIADNINLQTSGSSSGLIGVLDHPINTAGNNANLSLGGGALTGAFINHFGNVALQQVSFAANSNSPLRVVSTGGLTLVPGVAINTGSADLFLKSGATLSTAASLSAVAADNSAGGNITLQSVGDITIGHTINSNSKVILASSNGKIIETGSGAIINAAQLSTSSNGGQTLNGINKVASFDSSNVGSGDIQLNNSRATLTTIGINEAANGNIVVVNDGNINSTGAISTTGNVTLTANGGTITENGSGAVITAALLTTSSSGGQTLNGANTVSGFNATNVGGGDIQLTNKGILTITGINETAGGNIVVVNTGDISDTGVINTTGNVTLTAVGGAISESGAGAITNSALLTTNSKTGQTLAGTNSVASFNGNNDGSGDIQLVNAAGLLTIAGVSETVGGTLTIRNTGAVLLNGGLNTGTGGTVVLDTLGVGGISGAGLVTADTINLQTAPGSSGAVGTSSQSIQTKGTTTLSMGQGATLAGAFINHTGGLTLQSLSLAANSPLSVVSSGALALPNSTINTGSADLFLQSGSALKTAAIIGDSSATGNITMKSSGNITVDNNISTNGKVDLAATGGNIIGNGTISGGALALKAEVVGSRYAPINIITNDLSVKTFANSGITAYLASSSGFKGGNLQGVRGLAQFNGAIVGGDLFNDYIDALRSESSTTALAANSVQTEKLMQNMMQLASFEEFFVVAPKETILEVEEIGTEVPAFEFMRGVLPSGSSYINLEEKKK